MLLTAQRIKNASSEPNIAACPEPLENPDQPFAPHPFIHDPASSLRDRRVSPCRPSSLLAHRTVPPILPSARCDRKEASARIHRTDTLYRSPGTLLHSAPPPPPPRVGNRLCVTLANVPRWRSFSPDFLGSARRVHLLNHRGIQPSWKSGNERRFLVSRVLIYALSGDYL